jgi:membrane dipeptidase
VTGPPRTPAGRGAEGAYTAYSYLAAGEDFRRFELAPEFGRVTPYAAGLTAEQERRSRRLLTGSIVISLHDHPVRYPLRIALTGPGVGRDGPRPSQDCPIRTLL